jgi:polyisoprenoid-binding protein YceI
MKRTKLVSLLALGAISLAGFQSPAAQAGDTYLIDKPHTQIIFSVNRGGLTRLSGWFEKIDGLIEFDEANVENSSVVVTIETSSIKTGFKRRDQHFSSPDFFNVKEFLTMTFKSTKVVKTGANMGEITGDLTLLGVTKPVVLKARFNRKMFDSRRNKTFAGFSATAKFKRSDYGMKFLIGNGTDEVRIAIEALTVLK